MKIYLASSWKNERQPGVLAILRSAGHEVYDFRHPAPDDNGFSWRAIISTPRPWALDLARKVLAHEIAQKGFDNDFNAMKAADACVLLLPCGASAHLEAGWFAGQKKLVAVFADPRDAVEPELMWKIFGDTSVLCTTETELLALLGEWSLM